jgi:hypothetical protein
MAARGVLALLLAHHVVSSLGALDASDLSYLAWRSPSDAERTQFWADARTSSNLTLLTNDTSLPLVATEPGYFFRVAVCITGGARGFPLKSYGLYDSIKDNLVDALGANQTDIFCAYLTRAQSDEVQRPLTRALPDVLDLNSATDTQGKGGIFNYRRGTTHLHIRVSVR